MSAYIVSDHHIDAIVYWLLKADLIKAEDTHSVGEYLWWENHQSVNARYNENDEPDLYAYQVPVPIVGKFNPESPQHAYRLTRGYRYQSCEHDRWEASNAKALTEKLQEWLLSHGAALADHDGPWEI